MAQLLLKLDQKTHDRLVKIAAGGGYISTQDLIREIIRKGLTVGVQK